MKTVLVGESNYAEFEVLNDFLTDRGFSVHWVKSGPDAVKAFEETQPDLMIMDALIPGLTGIKVCQRVKKMSGGDNVKTILLSKVYRQFKQQYESRTKVGVDAYSEKPVNINELEIAIQDLLKTEPTAEPALELSMKPEKGDEAVDEARKTLGISGSLMNTPFPKLLFFLHKFKRTGALRVVHEHISKVIYLREGDPVFVTSNLSNESLGRFMVQRGVISVEQYNSSLEQMLEGGQQQGNVLLQMNVITPHQLYESLVAQVTEKIMRIFAWEEGEYEFRPGVFDIDESRQLKIPTMSMIFSGIKRFYTLARLERYFNEYKNQSLVRVVGSMLDKGDITFKPNEAKFVKLIDGDRTVGKIIARSNLSLSETFQVLYFLLLTEVIRFVGDPGFSGRGDQEQASFVAHRKERRDFLRRLAEDGQNVKYDKENKFRRAVTRLFEILEKLNHYEVLNLTRNATVDQVKHAYYQLTRIYHTYDLYNEADDVLKAKSDAIFRELTFAYEVLVDPLRKKEYDRDLMEQEEHERRAMAVEKEAWAKEEAFDFEDDGVYAAEDDMAEETIDSPDIEWDAEAELAAEGNGDTSKVLEEFESRTSDESVKEASEVTISMANAVRSELLFQQGEDAMNHKDFSEAIEKFAAALELNPIEAEYFAYLGWATFRENPEVEEKVNQARDLMEKAISINPSLDIAYTFLGLLEVYEGQRERARQHFEKALQYNPENMRAQSELKKLEVG